MARPGTSARLQWPRFNGMAGARALGRVALRWPLSALWVWLLAWGGFVGLRLWGVAWLSSLLAASLVGVLGSVWGGTPLRRGVIALGFPLSWGVASGQLALPPWVWLLLLVGLLLVYPPSTWRDAPLFPTPPNALDGLRDAVHLPLAGHVLDAGCGLGHGLLALERVWPDVHLHGVERSWPLAWLCRLRCWPRRVASVHQGDMWVQDWGRYDMVYLFQRPETMARAMAKAAQELKPGAWLASLEFADAAWAPTLRWTCSDGRPLWLYQAPLQSIRAHEAEASSKLPVALG